MAHVGDFNQIIQDSITTVNLTPGNTELPLPDFNTGGRLAQRSAFLMYSVRNMTGTAKVFINGLDVGTITPTPAGGIWSTQMIAVSGGTLMDGANEIVLKNVTDAFQIKNVNCFFHQNV